MFTKGGISRGLLERSTVSKPLATVGARARYSLRTLISATDGIALVETAMVAPFLAVIIMGTVDIARYGAAKLAVQQAVNRGLEMSMMSGPTLSTATIQAEAADQAGVATSAVTVTPELQCAGTAATWGTTCGSGQETAAYTKIQITTTFTPTFVFGALARMFGNSNGQIPIDVSGAIRIQ